MKNELMSIIPKEWRLIEGLGEGGILDIIANTRMSVAEDYHKVAKQLLENDMHDRSVISRAYYGMYHSARAVVYIRMRLDVPLEIDKEIRKGFN